MILFWIIPRCRGWALEDDRQLLEVFRHALSHCHSGGLPDRQLSILCSTSPASTSARTTSRLSLAPGNLNKLPPRSLRGARHRAIAIDGEFTKRCSSYTHAADNHLAKRQTVTERSRGGRNKP
jgi:hypothetical protein